MHRLNRELGTTFIIVTHDHAVARQTNRVLVMQDGRIVDDHQVGDPFEEDLKAFRDSELGQAILEGDGQLPDWLAPREVKMLRGVLEQG